MSPNRNRTYGIEPHPSPPYIMRYVGDTGVRFFLRQHALQGRRPTMAHLTRDQARRFARRWPLITRGEIGRLVDRMG